MTTNRFEKIYLWMDADGPGQEGTAKFAKKLGVSSTALYLMIYICSFLSRVRVSSLRRIPVKIEWLGELWYI